MTDRLYYEDSYLKAFEARIVSCRPAEDGGGFFITLDRSAFYPTSGGQPMIWAVSARLWCWMYLRTAKTR